MIEVERDHDRVTEFIGGMKAALHEQEANGVTLPIERRRLRTITRDCGRRGSAAFLNDLQERLNEVGVYTEPSLTDPGLRLDHWVRFSSGPFPPDSAFFPRERDLQRFVEACLGTGPFRTLEPYRQGRRVMCREFRLPDGRKIDLLCQERAKAGGGALVAIELKREHERGTIEQMISYLDALQHLHPGRTVKGVIISGREDKVAASLLSDVTSHDIRWYCYDVSFEPLHITAVPGRTA